MTLIDEGVAASLVYDFRAATGHGVEPTGHGLPAPSAEGALPMHLSMLAGQTYKADLSPDKGLLVTRFHYTNLVNLMDTTITGMTRDGTFWSRTAGSPRRRPQSPLHPVHPRRPSVRAVGSETELAAEDAHGAARAPALAIDRFAFSSATHLLERPAGWPRWRSGWSPGTGPGGCRWSSGATRPTRDGAMLPGGRVEG